LSEMFELLGKGGPPKSSRREDLAAAQSQLE
jgi:hypothetical protein